MFKTSRRRFLRNVLPPALAILVLAIDGNPVTAAAESARRPPNFLIFLVDDMGWIDPACYGNPFHETPNIDRFARQGMRFTDAYAACPVCSPTRASILTGKYPATLNLTDYIPGHWRPWDKLVVPKFHQELPLEEVTFAETLAPAGYTSGAFGKWHLGGPAHFPDKQGFDELLVTRGRHFYPRFRTTPKLDLEDGAYLADVLTDRAETFLETHRSRPFVLYLAHYAVHIPLEAKPELVEKYEQKESKPAGRVNQPVYAAMVEHVDQSLGRLLRKLEQLELAENTVVIFCSDNGGLYKRFDGAGPAVMSNAPLRNEKGSLYEGGVRVPLIIRWPGHVEPGSVCSTPVCSVDLYPTMTELAGIDDRDDVEVDGVSLVPLLKQTGGLKREALYWHYPHYHHTTPAGAIRQGDYKLIEYFDDGRVELYNLKDDLSEQKDLAAAEPEMAAELKQALSRWRKAVGAKMPTRNPEYDPARADQWKKRPRPSRRAR